MENKELIVRMRNELNLSRIKGYGRLEYLIYEYLTTQIGSNPYEPEKIRAIDLLKATKIGETNHVFLRKTTRNMIVGVEILTETKDIIQNTKDKKHKTKYKRQETKDKIQNTRNKRQRTKYKRQ